MGGGRGVGAHRKQAQRLSSSRTPAATAALAFAASIWPKRTLVFICQIPSSCKGAKGMKLESDLVVLAD